MNILPVARLFFSVRLRAAYTRLATGVPQRRHTPRPMRGSIVATGYTLTLKVTLKTGSSRELENSELMVESLIKNGLRMSYEEKK